MHIGDITETNLAQGGHKVSRWKKFPAFSRLFHSHKITFPQVIAIKSKCNNDLHQGSFHINSSNITGHHRTLTSSLFLMILFTQSTAVLHKYLNDELKYFVCYNFSLRLHRIPWELPEFSTFREIPEYSRFYRFPGLWQFTIHLAAW